MIYGSALMALALSAGFVDMTVGQASGFFRGRRGVIGDRTLWERQNASPTCLSADSIATASANDGQQNGDEGVLPGQAASETDKADFIHACDGKTITNGQQNKAGSCNPIPMGDIPAFSNMITAIITNPAPGDDIDPDKDFDIKLQVNHLQAGKFTNPTITYYAAPQRLNQGGDIIGHVHVTIQDLGDSLTPSTPPDPTTFAHFKGIDDAGDGNGGLTNTVTGGLKAGFYRLCTLTAAANHQPVIMPVAQRGAQDDCTKFTVGQGKGGGGQANGQGGNAGSANGAANGNGGGDGGGQANGQGGNAGSANGAANGNGGGDDGATASSASTTAVDAAGSAQPTTSPSGNQGGGNQQKGGRSRNGGNRGGQQGGQQGGQEGGQQGGQQGDQQGNQEQQRRGPKFIHKSRKSFKSRPYVMF